MPNLMKIYTNKEPSRVREIYVGNQKVLLRRARTLINSTNAAIVSFIEMMNFTEAGIYDADRKKSL